MILVPQPIGEKSHFISPLEAYACRRLKTVPINWIHPPVVIAGLVPAISLRKAMPCHPDRDGRDKPGHDELRGRIPI
jgi:hypothetical protein